MWIINFLIKVKYDENILVLRRIWKTVEPIVLGVVFALTIKTFFFQAYIIPSGSMMNTLLIGDCLLANRVAYSFKIPFSNKIVFNINNPKRCDIVVFKYPKNPKINYIKRIIGLPGETILIKNNKVFINGFPLEEKYAVFKPVIFTSDFDNFGPIKVPNNSIFVMGDNRNNSSDSRDWGVVDLNMVCGKAMIIYWSWDGVNKIPRFDRICKFLF